MAHGYLRLFFISLLATLVIACGGGSRSSSPSDQASVEQGRALYLSGFAIKGALIAANVRVYNLGKDQLLAETKTNTDGFYQLGDIDYQGPLLIEVTTDSATQQICDSATGCSDNVEFGSTYPFHDNDFKLTSVLPAAQLADSQSLMVTPVTHLAAQRILKLGLTDASEIEGILRATASLVGLEGLNINSLKPAPLHNLTEFKEADKEQQFYASLLTAFSTLAASPTNSELSMADMIDAISDDYAYDGGLSYHSDDADIISLSILYSHAQQVLAVIANQAQTQQIAIDLSFAQTQLATLLQHANNQPINQEFNPTVEPVDPTPADPTPVEPTEPEQPEEPTEPEPEPPLDQPGAVQKAVNLLKDLNSWQEALQSTTNSSALTPYNNQYQQAEEIYRTFLNQSAILTTLSDLVDIRDSQLNYAHKNPLIELRRQLPLLADSYTFINKYASDLLINSNQITLEQLGNRGFNWDNTHFDYINTELTTFEAIYPTDGSNIESIQVVMTSYYPAGNYVLTANITHNKIQENNQIIYSFSDLTMNTPQGLSLEMEQGRYSITFRDSDIFATDSWKIPAISEEVSEITHYLPATIFHNSHEILARLETQAHSLPDNSSHWQHENQISLVQAIPEASSDYESFNLNADFDFVNSKVSRRHTLRDLLKTPDLEAKHIEASADLIVQKPDSRLSFSGEIQLSFSPAPDTRTDTSADTSPDTSVDTNLAQAVFNDIELNFSGELDIVNDNKATGFDGALALKLHRLTDSSGNAINYTGVPEYFITVANLAGLLESNNDSGSQSNELNLSLAADASQLQLYNPIVPSVGDEVGTIELGFYEADASTVIYKNNIAELAPLLENNLGSETFTPVFSDLSNAHDTLLSPITYKMHECFDTDGAESRYCLISVSELTGNLFYIPLDTAPDNRLAAVKEYAHHPYDIELYGTRRPESDQLTIDCNDRTCSATADYYFNFKMPETLDEADKIAYMAAQKMNRWYTYSFNNCQQGLCDVTTHIEGELPLLTPYRRVDDLIKVIEGQGYETIRGFHIDSCGEINERDLDAFCIIDLNHQYIKTVIQKDIASDDVIRAVADIIKQQGTFPGDEFGQLDSRSVRQSNIRNYKPSTGEITIYLPPAKESIFAPAAIISYVAGNLQTQKITNMVNRKWGHKKQPEHIFGDIVCTQNISCTYSKSITNSVAFSSDELSDDQREAILVGRKSPFNNRYRLDSCSGENCIVVGTLSSSITAPDNVPVDQAATYARLRHESKATLYKDFKTTERDCHEWNGELVCQYPAVRESFMLYEITQPRFFDFVLEYYQSGFPAPAAWTGSPLFEFDTPYGDLQVSIEEFKYDHRREFFLNSATRSFPLHIVSFDPVIPEFDILKFEDAENYISLSGSLYISSRTTGLDDSSIRLFANRLNKDDAELSASFRLGARSLRLDINSLQGFANSDTTKLTIANEDTEMQITAICADLKNTEGEQDSERIEACDSGYNFEGEVFVAGFKVGKLIDRDGLPVFELDDGSDYSVLVAPNFLVSE
jgi:hypothetical protein